MEEPILPRCPRGGFAGKSEPRAEGLQRMSLAKASSLCFGVHGSKGIETQRYFQILKNARGTKMGPNKDNMTSIFVSRCSFSWAPIPANPQGKLENCHTFIKSRLTTKSGKHLFLQFWLPSKACAPADDSRAESLTLHSN